MSPLWALFLFGAGILGGLFATIGGLASLASYPALLLAGLSPASANVTNTVAMVATMAGATASARPELAGQRRRVLVFSAISLVGGVVGAIVLLTTPSRLFEGAVPWLIGGASVTLLLAPRLRRFAASERPGPASYVGIFLCAVYAGYFGAAAGMIMLAILAAVSRDSLARIAALKNVVAGAANLVAAVIFAFAGPVDWVAAPILSAGALIGGWLGPWLVRRLPAGPIRVGIAIAGLALALKLALG